MKKLIVALLLTATMAYAYQVYLASEYVSGDWRYCTYSNGQTISVPQYRVCPQSIKAD